MKSLIEIEPVKNGFFIYVHRDQRARQMEGAKDKYVAYDTRDLAETIKYLYDEEEKAERAAEDQKTDPE